MKEIEDAMKNDDEGDKIFVVRAPHGTKVSKYELIKIKGSQVVISNR